MGLQVTLGGLWRAPPRDLAATESLVSKLDLTSSWKKNLREFLEHKDIPSGPRSPKVDILRRPEDSYLG